MTNISLLRLPPDFMRNDTATVGLIVCCLSHVCRVNEKRSFTGFPSYAVYTIGRCVVLACSDYFKSTGVLVPQPAAAKGGGGGGGKKKKRDKRRRNVVPYVRQRDAFDGKTATKKSLTLNRIDIEDSFRHVFADVSSDGGGGSGRRTNVNGCMRFVDRSVIVNGRPKTTTGHRDWKENARTFSIVNVNDIIRDTDALLKL